MFLLDSTLPQVVKLSKALQTKQVDLNMISTLVDATLHAVSPMANWVVEFLDMCDKLEKSTEVSVQQTISRHFRKMLLTLLLPIWRTSSCYVTSFSHLPRNFLFLISTALVCNPMVWLKVAHSGEDVAAERPWYPPIYNRKGSLSEVKKPWSDSMLQLK